MANSQVGAMVCAAQPEAVEAGLDILAAGGNVVDAARPDAEQNARNGHRDPKQPVP